MLQPINFVFILTVNQFNVSNTTKINNYNYINPHVLILKSVLNKMLLCFLHFESKMSVKNTKISFKKNVFLTFFE